MKDPNMRRSLIKLSTITLLSLGASAAVGCLGTDGGDPVDTEKAPVASGTLSVVVSKTDVRYTLKDSSGKYAPLDMKHIQPTSWSGTNKPINWRTASGSPVDVFGTRNADGSISVDTLEPASGVTQSSSPLVTTGKKRVLVLNLSFDGGPALATEQDIRNVMDAAGRHFADSSFGKMNLEYDVASNINLSFGKCGDEDRWMNEAKDAAGRAGFDLNSYQHFEIFGRIDCGYGGLGQQPGELTWIAGLWPEVVIHELGHNFGDWHASSRTCTDGGNKVVMSDSCSFEEYGDPFDPMGHGGSHHYNANYKVNMGWIPSSNVALANGDKTYTLTPMTAPSSGIQLLRVQGPRDVMYQVEFRQPSPEDKFDGGDPNVHGVLIHAFFTQAEDAGRAHLLDMSPDGNFDVAALPEGQSYTFFGTSTTIRVLSTSAGGAEVQISGASGGGDDTGAGVAFAALHSGKCIDIAGGSTDNGAPAIQWPCTGAGNQAWDLQDQGNNVFVLKNRNSGKCLDVPDGTSDHAAKLQQWDCNGSSAQKFEFIDGGDDSVSLRSLASNLCLDVDDWSTADGANIIQWDCHGGANQRFHKR